MALVNLLAKFLAQPRVVDWLIRRAAPHPYHHITGPEGDVYMERYWLFNPYPKVGTKSWRRLFPSARLHRILREDRDRHMHDHPWDARTFILRNWYIEERLHWVLKWQKPGVGGEHVIESRRVPGDTASLKLGEYHRITQVHPDGVWTLFVTFKYHGTWGFLVDGQKVWWREYLNKHKDKV